MIDTRREIKAFVNRSYKFSVNSSIRSFLLSLIFALVVAFVPEYEGLSKEGVQVLFILLFAAALWTTEAIPAFAVSLLIIALEMIILEFHSFDTSLPVGDWQKYLSPWSSPLIFLFFAGFVMARAATKTKLDIWLAKKVLFLVGDKPKNVLTGMMIITFFLSMFMSNTATAAMMMAVTLPILASMRDDNPFQKALLLSIAVAANLGGMGTIIGTPPNAIAIGTLGESAPSFLGWMLIALPPALFMLLFMRFSILKLFKSSEDRVAIEKIENVKHFDDSTKVHTKIPTIPSWKKVVVITVFISTVLLWLSEGVHGVPTTVVSLLPVVAFTIFGIIDADDIRSLNWDILILIIGGLALGIAVSDSGLATWLANIIPLQGLSLLYVTLFFAYIVLIVSNFMSNTAATNIMLPLVVAFSAALGSDSSTEMVIAVALCASFAMALPVSTPPNAIVYASKKINSKEFLILGFLCAIVGPFSVVGWLLIF